MDKVESFCIDMDSRKADYMVEQLQDFDISEAKRALAHVKIEDINPIVGTSADKGKPFFELKGHLTKIEGSFHFPESGDDVDLSLTFADDEQPTVRYFYNIVDSKTEMAQLAAKGYFERDYSCDTPELLRELPLPIQVSIYKLNDNVLEAPIFAAQIVNPMSTTINKYSCGIDMVSLLPVYEEICKPKENTYQFFSQPEATKQAAKTAETRKDVVHTVEAKKDITVEQAAEYSEQELKDQRRRELFENSIASNNIDTYTEIKNAILKAAEQKEAAKAQERAEEEKRKSSIQNEAMPDKVGDYEDEEEKKKKAQLERNANIEQAEAADIDTAYSDGAPDL